MILWVDRNQVGLSLAMVVLWLANAVIRIIVIANADAGTNERHVFNLVLALSKEAMNFYSRSLAAEVGPKGVRVVNVLPGLIATVGAIAHHNAMAAERCIGFL
ncbi:SDR family oxidoreductase [Cryobacterium lyxosi]|uniref:SDR family oxidoreductase n=2 Tax=Cryobacterium lyxosi TaxID=1259228 RepID=A0A4R8ZKG8_9MICO|nr:SDR family oxidoreductase [Cryobacterium lyxosi]